MQYYEVYLSFGSNVGDRAANIETALKHLNDSGVKTVKVSSMYETEPWGNTEQERFLNCAAKVNTRLSPNELMNVILSIEHEMGREQKQKWEPRIIDIDILFFGKQIFKEDGLIIPHPEMEKRKFVLIPLEEIEPELIHPVLKKSIKQLLMECRDNLSVNKYDITI